MFIQVPAEYSSLYSDIMYVFRSTSTRDITISVENAVNGDIYGVKKFYSTTNAKINVAPLIRNYAIPEPHKDDVGFTSNENQGYVSVYLNEQEGDLEFLTLPAEKVKQKN